MECECDGNELKQVVKRDQFADTGRFPGLNKPLTASKLMELSPANVSPNRANSHLHP